MFNHVWPILLCCIAYKNLIKGMTFRKNVFDMEYVVIFSETSFHPGRIQQDIIVNILRSSFVVPDVFAQV
jgi:hypothetical protein